MPSNTYLSEETILPTRHQVESHPNITLVDSDKNIPLDIFCYRESNNIENDPLLPQCRGIIFSGDKLIMRTFGYTVEMDDSEEEKITSLLSDLSNFSFFKSYEGAILRVYFVEGGNISKEDNLPNGNNVLPNGNNVLPNGRWHLSTHRKINAFESKWSSKNSFGSFFVEALESEYSTNEEFRKRIISLEGNSVLDKFFNSLDRERQYIFLLRNFSENRIVCSPPRKPCLFHVSTYHNFRVEENPPSVGIKTPESLVFVSVKDVIEYVRTSDPFSIQGVIAFDKENNQYKIYNKKYREYLDVRGNEPNLTYRYFEVRKNQVYQKKFLELYPEYLRKVESIESTLTSLSKFLLNVFIQRYIKGKYVFVDPEEHSILKRLCESTDKKVNLSRITEAINNTPPNILYRIYRRKNS